MIQTSVYFSAKLSEALPKFSDKVILPHSLLSSIVSEFPDTLPHPLIFQVRYRESEIFLGVKEFSGEDDNEVGIPWIVQQQLEIPETGDDSSEPLHFTLRDSVPKGTSLKLKPIKSYPEIPNWKYFLESKLRDYTVLTKGKILYVEDKQEVYELYIEVVEPAPTVCIIDTDVILDIEDVHQDASRKKESGFIEEVELAIDVKQNEEKVYKIQRDKIIGKRVYIEAEDGDNGNVDMVIGDKLVSIENYYWTSLKGEDTLDAADFPPVTASSDEDVDLDSKWLYVIPYVWTHAARVNIIIKERVDGDDGMDIDDAVEDETADENVQKCSNCDKYIPKNSMFLHENFCKRNNVKCTCGRVFLKKIPETHWKCEHCDQHGDSETTQVKHYKTYHDGPYTCPKCNEPDVSYATSYDLVLKHRATDCPHKLHECRFCHLIVPQEEANYEDKFNNLTHHENYCGNKTTECYKCGKILKLKDISKHMKVHELEKVTFNQAVAGSTAKCSNANCINIVPIMSSHSTSSFKQLGLCDLCNGPVYSSADDPTNLKLQGRIERKYVIQLSKGCGNSWCKNIECKSSGIAAARSMKDVLQHVKELLGSVSEPALPTNKGKEIAAGPNSFWFCVDQNTTKRKLMVENLCVQGEYRPELVYKAVNEVRDISEERIRDWLEVHAIKAV